MLVSLAWSGGSYGYLHISHVNPDNWHTSQFSALLQRCKSCCRGYIYRPDCRLGPVSTSCSSLSALSLSASASPWSPVGNRTEIPPPASQSTVLTVISKFIYLESGGSRGSSTYLPPPQPPPSPPARCATSPPRPLPWPAPRGEKGGWCWSLTRTSTLMRMPSLWRGRRGNWQTWAMRHWLRTLVTRINSRTWNPPKMDLSVMVDFCCTGPPSPPPPPPPPTPPHCTEV